VVFHPGTPMTRVMGRWGHAAAVDAGVRLVSVSRPGYGGSTTTEMPSLPSVGQDTAALAAHLGLDGYAVVGSSGGGPFAVATAVADSKGVRALGVVGGVGPWRLLEPPSSLPEERECLALLDAGEIAEALAGFDRQAKEELDGLTLDEAVDVMLADDDSSLIHDDRYRALWADNMREVMGKVDGYVLDNLAWGGNWDLDPRDVGAPSLLWYGARDERCPPAHGHWYGNRIPGSQLVIFPNGGHFDVIDGHWPEILAGLLRVWA
jgi:pimeloyl-ACP methyl ester carboxylesterase